MLRVFVKLNPTWPVPLLSLVVGRSCLAASGTSTVRSPAFAVCKSLVLDTLHAASVSARQEASPPTSIVTLSRAFECLIVDGQPRLMSLSKICKVWFDDSDILALHHLANCALRKLFEACHDRMDNRTAECWLPAIMGNGTDPTNSLSKAMTPKGVFLRRSYFLTVMVPFAKAVYAFPCESKQEYEVLCSMMRSSLWATAVHNVVFAFFEKSVRVRAETEWPDLPDVRGAEAVVHAVDVHENRQRLREEMEAEIETFISGWLSMKFVRMLLSVRLKKLNTKHREVAKVQNYRQSGDQSNK